MKKFILISILLIPIICYSQSKREDEQQSIFGHDVHLSYFVLGANTGFNFKINRPNAALNVGYRLYNFYASANMVVTTSFNSTNPIIFPFTLGYNIGSIQPFFSYSYQTIGAEAEQRFKGTPNEFINGWRTGFGLSYYFRNFPLSITAQRQGKINSLSVGVYKSF